MVLEIIYNSGFEIRSLEYFKQNLFEKENFISVSSPMQSPVATFLISYKTK